MNIIQQQLSRARSTILALPAATSTTVASQARPAILTLPVATSTTFAPTSTTPAHSTKSVCHRDFAAALRDCPDRGRSSYGSLTDKVINNNSLNSNIKCPEAIRVDKWWGRFGNHLHQVCTAVLAAELCNTGVVELQPYPEKEQMNFRPPRKIKVARNGSITPTLPRQCPQGKFRGVHWWYHTHLCHNFTAIQYRRVALQHVRPMLGSAISDCLERPWSTRDNDVLTIHLRLDDVTRELGRYPGQPPCSMYDRILIGNTFKFKEIRVISAGTKNCDCCGRIEMVAHAQGISVFFTASTLANDFCQLARARHLVVSFSTFAIAAALVSTEVRTIFRRGDSNWGQVQLHSMLPTCQTWPGVTMYEYSTEKQLNKYTKNQSQNFLLNFPVGDVCGPRRCCT